VQGLDLRNAVDGLTTRASRDLAALWQRVSDAVAAREPLYDILPALIDTYGAAASSLAAEWYDEVRAKAGVGGSFTAIPADVKDLGVPALIGYAESKATDYTSFRTLIEGGMQRRIANFSRGTVIGSAVRDPKAEGWQRVGAGACAFCAMLISRGSVYRTAESADFASHDHCRCSALMVWSGESRPVRPYTPTNRNITDADRARVRAWIATNL
jgi:hypothetical protein